ncbi:MAG: orotidine-5'-phosphate decarboxylase [Bacteroidales bacterium]|nr:orotidine-5'-phosphate decarboxylase [Bacteroidales bacterium]
MTQQQLIEQIKLKKSFLCVGLDSDLDKIPEEFKNFEDPVFEFNKMVVEATYKYTVAYKPNLAFYECRGLEGWKSLEKTVNYISEQHPDIFLIADAKRGDIGNTSQMYAKTFFEKLPFHAVTVAPYMGEDSVSPFLSYSGKWVILLALTSNKGAADFQYFTNKEGIQVFEEVLSVSQKWADDKQMMYVVGATKAEKLTEIRKIVPNHFLLVPGVGAQGGSLEEVAKFGMNGNCGLLVNNSRAIIFAGNKSQIEKAAKQMQEEMSVLLKEFSSVL